MVVKLWLSLTKLTRKLPPTGSAGLGERTVNVLAVPSTRAARICCTDESLVLTRSKVKLRASELTRCQDTVLGPTVVHPVAPPGLVTW